MIEIDRLPIADITEQHLLALVTEKAAEGRTLEFKQDIKIGSDGDKKEFCTDVASFANGAGGLMLHGIRAGKDAEQGVAVEVVGIETTNIESLVSQAEQVLYNGISPRLMVGVRAIPLAGGKFVLAIKVQRSSIAPHAVGRDGVYRFFTRGTNGKLPMDIPQVRSSFLLSEGLRERLRSYRAERVGRIIANDGIVPLTPGHKLVLQVIPLASLAEPADYDVAPYHEFQKPELQTMGGRQCSRREFNMDGVADVYRVPDTEASDGYAQIYQNGIIEYVDAGLVFFRSHGHERYNNSISATYIVSNLLSAVDRSLTIYQQLQIETPVYIMVSMLGVRNMAMWVDDNNRMPKACDRDDVYFSEIVVVDLRSNVHTLLRPMIDSLWRTFGRASCFWYHDDGTLKLPGR